jgi:hypothetical protein
VEAKGSFGGHRKKAAQDIDRAIHQLNEGLKYAREHDKK